MRFDRRKDLLGLRDVSREEIEVILGTAIPERHYQARYEESACPQRKRYHYCFLENSTPLEPHLNLLGNISAQILLT